MNLNEHLILVGWGLIAISIVVALMGYWAAAVYLVLLGGMLK
jgi:hypothetical protein